MNSAVAGWVLFRLLRWLCFLGFVAFSLYFLSDPRPHLNSFGQLLLHAEIMLFGLGVAGMFAGLFELMMREHGAIARPHMFQLWPGYVARRTAADVR